MRLSGPARTGMMKARSAGTVPGTRWFADPRSGCSRPAGQSPATPEIQDLKAIMDFWTQGFVSDSYLRDRATTSSIGTSLM
jgi:hypothetical protein